MSSKKTEPIHPGIYVKSNIIPKDISIKKAAEMMGIGRPALSNFLNGRAALSMNMCTRLEKTFGAKRENLLALQQCYETFNNREEEKHIAVRSYTPSFLKITAAQIEAWTQQIEARSLLPVLLRRLVHTTGAEVISSNFPGYDKSQTPGWDGQVESKSATPWIPFGLSGWEFGCDKIPKQKADKDYKARTEATPNEERKQTTFVFVTPKSWAGKREWVIEARKKNEWHDVRAFDASDIEQWLELSLSTQVWMAEQIGLQTSDCQSLDDYWSLWSKTTEPAISPKIFKSAISDHGQKIKEWYLSNPVNPLVLAAASKEEARAFFCCLLQQVPELQALSDRAIFVSTPQTIRRFSEISTEFIPIVHTEDAQSELANLAGKRPSIIISEKNIQGTKPDICIDLPNFESFKEALEDMGFDEAQINVLANQSAHSPTILRRLLAKIPAPRRPKWATSTKKLRTIIPLVFAGSWSINKEADREIISCLADQNYFDIEKEIAALASIDDSPIWIEGKHRGVVSQLECFYSIAELLTEGDVGNFFDLAEYVLSEDDPALDLHSEKRWAANLYNKIRDHSPAIRKSISQNLIVLAVHGDSLFGQRIGINIESRVARLIEKLLKSKTPRVWQAQQIDLPSYAEAAPNMFLSIIEEELKKKEPAFKILFESAETGFLSRCERTGMLWALELLAWNPTFLARVVKILGKLSMYGLDDNWTNKPINSLKDILLIWRPHTSATVEQRCDVLEMLCKQYPEIGWKMCIQPFEPGGNFTSGTYRPRWRSDASGSGKNATNAEAKTYGDKCLELAFSWPSHTLKTLQNLVDCLPVLLDEYKRKVVGLVKAWVENSPDEKEIIELREHVRTNTMTTRAIRQNKKRKGNNFVNGKELYEILEPKDLLAKHQWLFAKGWVEYSPEELDIEDFDHKTREKGLAKQRVDALKEILSEKGIPGILTLINRSGSDFQIGAHMYNEIFNTDKLIEFLLAYLETDNNKTSYYGSCISGILFQIEENDREGFINDLLSKIPNDSKKENTILKILLCAPFCKKTWDFVAKQSEKIQRDFWLQTHAGWNQFSSEDLSFSVNKLLEVERPLAAFDLAHYKLGMLESKLILKLLNAITNNSIERECHYKPSKFDIEEALKTLNTRDDFDRLELIQLEYLYIDALYSHSSYGIPNLAKEVSKSPLFFMQLVACCFKRNDDGEDPIEWKIPQDDEGRRITATKAYHVIECIDVIPGTKADGTIDVRELREWILEVRKLAKEYGREKITDQRIGSLLAKSSEGKDGIWPKEEIREVFEEIGSTEISTGMELGLLNTTGAEFRAMDSSRERANAEKYTEMAAKVINKTPFVGKMLNNIANIYNRDAQGWDADLRIRKRLNR